MERIMRSCKDSFCFSSESSQLGPKESWQCINLEMKNILERKNKKKPIHFRFSYCFTKRQKNSSQNNRENQKQKILSKKVPFICFNEYVLKKQNNKNDEGQKSKKCLKKQNICKSIKNNVKKQKDPIKLNIVQMFEIKNVQILQKNELQFLPMNYNYTSRKSESSQNWKTYVVQNKGNKIRMMRRSIGQIKSNSSLIK